MNKKLSLAFSAGLLWFTTASAQEWAQPPSMTLWTGPEVIPVQAPLYTIQEADKPAAPMADPAAPAENCDACDPCGKKKGLFHKKAKGCEEAKDCKKEENGNGNGEDECKSDKDEPWTILGCLADKHCCIKSAKEKGWTFGGQMAWGYSNNPDGAFIGNGPFLNQKEWDAFVLDQAYLFLGKEADGSKGFDWGFRADVMYGIDGNEGQAFGNINPGHWDYLNGFDHGIYEWALPQAYGEVAVGDLKVKAGRFYTLIGYEVVPATGNFFYSRTLNFWNSEPFTHTGVMGEYAVNDKLSVHAGWVLGWDTGFYQFSGGSAGHVGFIYKPDDKTEIINHTMAGDFGWRGNGIINSTILSRQWTEKMKSVHQFDVLGTDLRLEDGTPANFRNPDSYTARNSTGLINYLFYDLSDKVKLGSRAEWYKADGTSYYTLTGGVNFIPRPNLTIRPEVRYMWSPGNHDIYSGSGYSDELFNQTVFGIDAVFTF